MERHFMLVLTNPVEGREDEYNDWYNQTHLGEVLGVEGFVAAQRFEINALSEGGPFKYLAIYEIEAEDPNAIVGKLMEAMPGMNLSKDMDASRLGMWMCTPLTERMRAG